VSKRFFAVVFVFLCVFAIAQQSASGLVGWYSFTDCQLQDRSPLNRAPIVDRKLECAPGRSGLGLRFRGVTKLESDRADTVRLENTPKWALSEGFSVALWFKLESHQSYDGDRKIVANGAQTLLAKSGDRTGFTLRLERSRGDGLWYLYATNGRCCEEKQPQLEVSFARGGVKLGEWHFVVVTFDALRGEVKLFQNGVQRSSLTTTEFNLNPSGDAEPVFLGAERGGLWYPFAGLMDEVRLYDRALSSAEILRLYAGAER
jgi:hypothetical protein